MIKSKVVKKAIEAFSCNADVDFFFENLKSPDWIKPLLKEGFFQKPPEAFEKGGYVRTTTWAQSKYLVRMAKESDDTNVQRTISDIALNVPQVNNDTVFDDVVKIALALPPKYSKDFVPKIQKWLEFTEPFLAARNFGKLIAHLAIGKMEAPAFQLAKTVLKVSEKEKEYGAQTSPKRRLVRTYEYQTILKEILPNLIECNAERTLNLFVGLLDTALENKFGGEGKTYGDMSYMWRPTIEDTENNRYEHGIKFHLTTAVRGAAEIYAQRGPDKTLEVIGMLEGKSWSIFKRLTMHIIRLYPDHAGEKLFKTLSDLSLYDDFSTEFDYVLLGQQCFMVLKPKEREEILSKVTSGPNDKTKKLWKQRYSEHEGQSPPEEKIELFSKRWARNRMYIFKDHLPERYLEKYDKLVSEVGEPHRSHGKPKNFESTWVGPTSPKSVDELKSMSLEELISFLKTWEYKEGFKEPTPRGLGRNLEEVISNEPSKYLPQLSKFIALDPTYVSHVFGGFLKASWPDKKNNWSEIIKLANWVLEQPPVDEGRKGDGFDIDLDWSSTCHEIAQCLSAGFRSDGSQIPFELREDVWPILYKITEDPDPTAERDTGDEKDPNSIAINSTRGEAIFALIGYALWVKRNLIKKNPDKDPTEVSFENMPEVKEVLELHLDIEKEPTLAIRSIYGKCLHNLRWLDEKWLKSNKDLIFPKGDNGKLKYFSAAWNSYLLYGRFDNSFFGLLNGEYEYALSFVSVDKGSWVLDSKHAADNYASHIVLYYWDGQISLEKGSLIRKLYDVAPLALRKEMISFAGRSLDSEKGEIPEEVLQRFTDLWIFRLEACNESREYEELEEFGHWARSNKFDPEWVIDQIILILKYVKRIEPDYIVSRYLSTYFDVNPLKVLECVQLVFEGDKIGWAVHTWSDNTVHILKEGLKNDDEHIAKKADDIRNFLITKGYKQFRELKEE